MEGESSQSGKLHRRYDREAQLADTTPSKAHVAVLIDSDVVAPFADMYWVPIISTAHDTLALLSTFMLRRWCRRSAIMLCFSSNGIVSMVPDIEKNPCLPLWHNNDRCDPVQCSRAEPVSRPVRGEDEAASLRAINCLWSRLASP